MATEVKGAIARDGRFFPDTEGKELTGLTKAREYENRLDAEERLTHVIEGCIQPRDQSFVPTIVSALLKDHLLHILALPPTREGKPDACQDN